LQSRVVLLVDLDYFFAQCEELRNPSLRDVPVVVCVYSGRSEDSGAVSTANYIARSYGVKSGMPIFLAKKKLEKTNAAFLPADYIFYEGISSGIMETLRSHADVFEQAGIDEAYIDVSRRIAGSFDEAEKLAEKIRDEILNQHKLTCSIGVGPNKLVAKIAADKEKPRGLTVVRPEQVKVFLAALPVGRLIGVGQKTRERMQALGINTVLDLSEFDIQKLIAIFGKTVATYFHNASLGIDDEPVQDRGEPTSMSRISTLKHDSRELGFILEKTDQLCNEIYSALVDAKLAYKTVGILIVTKEMSVHNRSKTLENPERNLETMKAIVKELLEKFLERDALEVRRVGIRISNFAKEEKNQSQLTRFMNTNWT